MGPPGIGKTSVLFGRSSYDSGTIFFDGEIVTDRARHEDDEDEGGLDQL